MGMSNAERQRLFRQRRDADPDRRQKYLQKGRERYQIDCKQGKVKPIAQLNDRDKRAVRKRWRLQKRKDRLREKEIRDRLKQLNTPPSTPEHEHQSSRQKEQHKKKKRREEAKSYRERKKMELEIQKLKRKVEMYKKRMSRKHSDVKTNQPDTPRRRTLKLLRNFTPKEVKKSLFGCQVLIEALRQKYKEKRKKEKANYAKILCNKTLKKYHLKNETYRLIGLNSRSKREKKGYDSLSKRIAERVHVFYTRNDNSRLITGKKQTKTCKKVRKQRRIMLSNLKSLYRKFLSEEETQISYSVFCRLRPFYVVFPRISDRNTCLCKTCNNTELMADALKRAKATESANLNVCIKHIVCDVNEQKCMYSGCNNCKDKTLEIDKSVLDKDITWFEWVTKREVRKIKRGKDMVEKPIYITVKECNEGTVNDLADRFHEQVQRYQKHIYRTYSQYNHYGMRKKNLEDTECVMHIDFSENYVCGYNEEVQSVHFGASKRQISLQTGVIHLKGQSSKTFCTVSDSLAHGPEGVWGHLKPVLTDLKKERPYLSRIEIFSDGPVTQYKQKANFYLASTKGKEYNFENITWSFFEAGHGKGVPDAVGGAMKRQADNAIKYGQNITDAKSFCDAIPKDSNVKLYLVPKKSIDEVKQALDNVALKAVPGTLNLHQVICKIQDGKIAYRNLSCHCEIGNEHTGHEFHLASILDKTEEKDSYKDENNNTVNQSDDQSETVCEGTNEQNEFSSQEDQFRKVVAMKTKHANINLQTKKTTCKRKTNKQKSTEKGIKRKCCDETNYKALLEPFERCKTMDELVQNVNIIPEIAITVKADELSLNKNDLDIEYDAIKDIPTDIKLPGDTEELYPVQVNTDGNCLPSCGSVFAFGTPDKGEEIRARIVQEMAMHEDLYLNNIYLQEGISKSNKSLKLQYAQYSEYYIPGINLDNNSIKEIYRKEVLSITENKTFMGIWQIFALASVLKCPIHSVYPNRGNANVRQDLNRLIMPRMETDSCPVYILWTNTRLDIPNEHWVPNHFVALVPLNSKPTKVNRKYDSTNVKDKQTEDNEQQKQATEPKNTGNNGTEPKTEEPINTENNSNEHQLAEPKNSGNNGNEHQTSKSEKIEIFNMENETGEHNRKEKANKTTEQGKITEKENSKIFKYHEIENLNKFVGKHVLVRFRGRPYPGYVLDIDETDLFISCMHQVGRKAANCFYWPKTIKDIAWYTYEDIICIIPEPVAIENSRHLRVNENAWNAAVKQ